LFIYFSYNARQLGNEPVDRVASVSEHLLAYAELYDRWADQSWSEDLAIKLRRQADACRKEAAECQEEAA